jgi:gamma-glutamyl hydrolase
MIVNKICRRVRVLPILYLFCFLSTCVHNVKATTIATNSNTNINNNKKTTLLSRPVVGILSQPFSQHPAQHYIAASYVKWLESAGARSIAIPYDADEELLEEIFTQINGVFFPGGNALLPPNAKTIWKMILERNDKNGDGGEDFFPAWGTCLGFEFLIMLAAGDENALQSGFDSENISLPLIFPSNEDVISSNGVYSIESQLYPLTSPTRQSLASYNLTMNNHHQGITPSQFLHNKNLTDFFHITSTNYDKKGREFVSTVESKNYPIYGIQYHPEKNNFEYGLMDNLRSPLESLSELAYYVDEDEPYEAINHSEMAIEFSMKMALFFVRQVRRSTYGSYDMVERHPVIYQYPMIRGRGFEQIFLIPRAANWNYEGGRDGGSNTTNTTTTDHWMLSFFILCFISSLYVLLQKWNDISLPFRGLKKNYFFIPENSSTTSLELLVEEEMP